MRNNLKVIKSKMAKGREQAIATSPVYESIAKTFTETDCILSLPRCLIHSVALTPIDVTELPEKFFGVNMVFSSTKEEIRRGFNITRQTVDIYLGIQAEAGTAAMSFIHPLTSVSAIFKIAREG